MNTSEMKKRKEEITRELEKRTLDQCMDELMEELIKIEESPWYKNWTKFQGNNK